MSPEISKSVCEVLDRDAVRWERLVKFITDVQDNKSGASLFQFDGKAKQSIAEHIAGLRGMSKLLSGSAPAPKVTPATVIETPSRASFIEID